MYTTVINRMTDDELIINSNAVGNSNVPSYVHSNTIIDVVVSVDDRYDLTDIASSAIALRRYYLAGTTCDRVSFEGSTVVEISSDRLEPPHKGLDQRITTGPKTLGVVPLGVCLPN